MKGSAQFLSELTIVGRAHWEDLNAKAAVTKNGAGGSASQEPRATRFGKLAEYSSARALTCTESASCVTRFRRTSWLAPAAGRLSMREREEIRAGWIGLMMTQHFAYAIDNRYLPMLLPFGLRRAKDGVTLTDDSFLATFGF